MQKKSMRIQNLSHILTDYEKSVIHSAQIGTVIIKKEAERALLGQFIEVWIKVLKER